MFEEIRDKIREEEYEERIKEWNTKARNHWWRNGKLNSVKKKLFFVLYYLKTYPTFDEIGYVFWLSRSATCDEIHILVPILQKTFEALWVSPKRTIESPQDWQEAFGRNIEELIVDATERKHFRHKDNDKQKEHYSGKKNFIPRKTSS